MSDWKDAEARECQDFLYVEEVNANDGESRRVTGMPMASTVKDLKQSIAGGLRSPESWDALAVAFGDKELSALDATLGSFGIQDGDTIFFTRSVIPQVLNAIDDPPPYSTPKVLNNVMFQDVDGKTMTLNFIPINWKVTQLRRKLGEDKAMEVEFYRFLVGGKQLDDGARSFPIAFTCSLQELISTADKTLEAYNVSDNCTIHMVMRLKGGLPSSRTSTP